ncbi:MAG: fibronectin type III domain-containing protein [bacterium]
MKIRKPTIIATLFLTLGVIFGLGIGDAEAGVNVTFNPSRTALSPGETFWVTVDVDQVDSPMSSVHLNAVEFDATRLEVKAYEVGDLMTRPGTYVGGYVDNEPNWQGKGYANLLVRESGTSPVGVTGSGSVVKVKFQVRSGVSGTAKIGLTAEPQNPLVSYRIFLKEVSGKEIPVDSITPTTVQIMGPPSPPTNLTATTVSSSQIRLNWTDSSDNEDVFVIERKAPGASSYSEVTTVSANTEEWFDTGLAPNIQYCYRVKARNAVGDSNASNESCATTQDVAPSNPTGLTATSKSTSRIDLAWNDLANEAGYAIQARTATTSFADIDTVSANTTSYSHTGLSTNTTYYYQIRAFNAIGVSGYSSTAEATTYDNPPTAPTGLVLSGVTANKIDFNWTDNSNNEAGFEIERKTETQPSYSLIDTVGAGVTNFSNTGLDPNTHYYYRVRAWSVNIAGDKNWSPYSNAADTTTLDIPPNAPSGLRATPNSSSQITLDWTDNSNNETGFKIERRTAATSFTEIGASSANVNQFIDTGLSPNTIYYYQVRAYNNAGNSGYSNTALATTNDVPPAPPGNLQAAAISDSRIDLFWADNSGNEDGFIIERGSAEGGPFSKVGEVDTGTTTYSNTGLTPRTTYYYRVKAYNGLGHSAPSNVANATTNDTFPAAPSNLSLSDTGIYSLRLNWSDNANNETGFRIERKTAGGAYIPVAEIPAANTTTYLDTGLNPETTYTYRVRAYNGAGNSGYSNEASGTTLPSHYTLTVSSIYGSPAPGVGPHSYASGASVTASVSSPVINGTTRYVCTGWTGTGSVPASGGGTTVTFNITQTSTIAWQWRVEYQLLTAVNNPEWGEISPTSGGWYEADTQVTITATPKTGYTFSGWAGHLSGSTNPASLTMNGPKSVAANFTSGGGPTGQCGLTVVSIYGSPSPGVGTHSYDSGTFLTASVTSPVSGGAGIQYVCTGWTGTGSVPASGADTSVFFNLTQDSTITWNWKTEYYLTTSVNPSGAGGVTPSSGWYKAGETVNLAAVPEGCFTFLGWTGDLSGPTNPSPLSMNGPRSVAANFSGRMCHGADDNCDDQIDNWELLDHIDRWANNQVDNWDLLDAIDIWTRGSGACSAPASVPAFSPPLFRSPPRASSNPQVTVIRTLDCSSETAIGGELAVDVDESNKPKGIIIEEYIPVNWTLISSNPDPDVFNPATGKVSWVFYGSGITDRTITYQVQVGSGSKGFRGQVFYNDPTGTPITRDIEGDTSCEEEVTLTVVSPYDSPSPAAGVHSYSPGTSVTASVTSPVSGPAGTRYVCMGWIGTGSVPSSGSNTSLTFTINQDSTLTWNWKTEYYLTTSVSPAGGGTISPSSGWYESGQSVALTAVPASGYHFSGWSGDLSGMTNPTSLIMSGPKSVTANFNRPPVANAGSDQTVGLGSLVVLDGSLSSDPDGNPLTYQWTQTAGPAVTLSNPTAQKPTFTPLTPDRYHFRLVVNDGQLDSNPDEVIITVTACVNQYALTVSSAYDSPSPSTGTHCYPPGTPITASVTSPVSDGTGVRYVCTGWTGTGSVPVSGPGTSIDFTITQDSTITWHWKTEYQLTTSVNPGGAGTISPAAGWYEEGIILAVKAIPSTGYAFTAWSGDLSGSNSSTSLTMNLPKTITANFQLVQLMVVSLNAPAEVIYDSAFTAAVNINQISSLDHGNIQLDFDSNLFKLLSLDKGSLISGASSISSLSGAWFFFDLPEGPGVSGAGTLMEAKFKAIGPPSSVGKIDISDISLGDAAGQEIVVNSVVGTEVKIKIIDDKPAPPTNLKGEVISLTRIDLSWSDNSTNEAGFEIEQKKGTGGYSWLATISAGVTFYSDQPLSPETTYCYRVRAYNNHGYSDWSNERCATTTEMPPPKPTNLKAAAVSPNQIDLTWNENSANNERGFKVERSLTGGGAGFSQIGEVSANVTVYQDQGLNPKTTYFYRVKAWNNQGDSPYSSEASATTLRETGLKINAPETVVTQASFKAVVEVTAVDDLSLVSFRMSFDPTVLRLISTEAGDLISSLNPTISSTNASGKSTLWINIPGGVSGSGGLVKFGFEAIGAVGDSSRIELDSLMLVDKAGSNIQVDSVRPVQVTITGSPPPSPTNLSVTRFGQNSITLAWQDNAYNETGFILERKTSPYAVIAILPANITTYTDRGLSPGTLYYYRVKAYNDFGESGYSNEVTPTCCPSLPVPPTHLTAAIISSRQVELGWWDNSDNEAGFKIERSLATSGLYSEIAAVPTNVKSYIDTGVSPCISYSYRVKAYNEAGDSDYSNETTITAQGSPESPLGLTGEAVSFTQVNLSWPDSDNEAGYKIERSQKGTSFTQIGIVDANVTSYSDSGLNPEVAYCYRVRAYNECGESNYTNEVCLTTGVMVKVVAPATVSYGTTFEASIEVSHVTSLDILRFKLEFNPSVLQVVPPVNKGTLTSPVVEPMANIQNGEGWLMAIINLPGTAGVSGEGSVAIIEFKAIGTNGAVSELQLPEFNMGDSLTNPIPIGEIIPARVEVIGGPPQSPYNLKATAISETGIELAWQSRPGDKLGFIIEKRKLGETFGELTRLPANVTTYTDSNLESETTYCYQVKAYNNYGESGLSNEACAITPGPLAPPDNLSAAAESSSQIRLNWMDNSTNETGFKIERRKKGSNIWNQIGATPANATTYLDSGLESETTYYYQVRAYEGARHSGYSNEASATTPGSLPAAPDNLRGQEVLHNQIKITWRDNSTNETGFKIEKRTGAAGSFDQIDTVFAGVTVYQDTDVNPETSYYYRVRAYNQGGDSAYSNIVSLQTPPSPPVPPSDLTANAVSSSRIDLFWQDNSLNEDGFKIERRLDLPDNWVQIKKVGAEVNQYHDIEVSHSTTYYYRVRASSDKTGDSEYSNIASVATSPLPEISPVKLAFASDRTGDYEVYLMDDNGGAVTQLTDAPEAQDWQPAISPDGTKVVFVSDREGSYDIYLMGAGGTSLTRLTSDPAEDIEPAFSPDGTQIVFSSNRDGDYEIYWLKVNDPEPPTQLTQNTAQDHSPAFSPDGTQILFVSDQDGNNEIYTMDVNGYGVSPLTSTNYPVDNSQPCFSPDGARIAFSSNQNGNDEIYVIDSNGENLENITNRSSADMDAAFSPNGNLIAFTSDRDGHQEIYLINIAQGGEPKNLTNHSARDIHPSFGLAGLPMAPANLSLRKVEDSQVELQWQDRSIDEQEFVIERRIEGGSYSQRAAVGPGITTYLDSVTPKIDYCYQVRAKNEYGASEPSNEVCLSDCCLAPNPPAGLSAEVVSDRRIKLTWTDNSDNESHFKIERSRNGNDYYTLSVVGANETTYNDSDFDPGSDYYYQVRAVNAQGESDPSNEALAKVALPPPTNLTGKRLSDRQVKLTWQDNSEDPEEDGFSIERKTEGGRYAELAAVGRDETTYQDTGLEAEKAYYYRVRAYDNLGRRSKHSNEVKVPLFSEALPVSNGLMVYPNPFFYREHNQLTFEGDISVGGKIWIYTPAGELAQTLSIDTLEDNNANGQKVFTWINPTNEQGERLASGIYIYLLKGPKGKAIGKLAVVH